MAWATRQQAKISPSVPLQEKAEKLAPEKLHMICVLLAGTWIKQAKDILTFADSMFGINFSPEELDAGLDQLVQSGLIILKGNTISIQPAPMEKYIQEAGLWSYVRMLRRDFIKKT